MARDKGYGGRSKRKQIQDSIMHEREWSSHEDAEDAGNIPIRCGSSPELHLQMGRDEAAATTKGSSSAVHNMTEEQISF